MARDDNGGERGRRGGRGGDSGGRGRRGPGHGDRRKPSGPRNDRSGSGRRQDSGPGGRQAERRPNRASGTDSRNGAKPERRDITLTAGGDLPRWVREEVTRSTPKDRREPALIELTAGLVAFVDERFRQAATSLRKAKALSPRAATVREVLGLAAYNIEAWEEALRELRTFRRITGDTTHMAVELDCLRALGRESDVEKAWQLFGELGGSKDAEDEVRVVYASHLLDQGRVRDAWLAIKPGRLIANPPESAVRRWAVAARVATTSGDRDTASKIVEAIRRSDPDVEWLAELEAELKA